MCGAPPWRVVSRLRAGDSPAERLWPGTACEVVTGAPVPEAAAAVLPYEHAARHGLSVSGPVNPGRHIRRAGEECRAGEQVLSEGHVVTPATLGLVAALGLDTLPVHPRPVVQAFVTGDELVREGSAAPGRVRDAIGPMLPGLIHGARGRFGEPIWLTDDARLLAESIRCADAPVILVSGSSSRGPADHLRSVLDGLGARWIVNGVRCRPGHPQAMARLPGGAVVVGLPGNPYAALVAFLTLALPALTGLGGRPLPTLAEVPPDPAWTPRAGLTRVLPATRDGNRLRPIEHGGSAMLRGVAMADALAVLTPDGRVRAHRIPGTPGTE